jgi:hypothetical protein
MATLAYAKLQASVRSFRTVSLRRHTLNQPRQFTTSSRNLRSARKENIGSNPRRGLEPQITLKSAPHDERTEPADITAAYD